MTRALLLPLANLLLSAQASEVEITAEPHHHFILQNDQVRVFNLELAPHSETLMHWHRHDYFFIVLGDAEVSNDVKGKPPATLKLQNGEIRFLPATFAHIARNLSTKPFRNVTIELLRDEKLRQSAKTTNPWKETRGLEVLHGGAKEILFVRDNVRATEFELQPGATLPLHHHSGPHLLIAVTDLEIRSDVQGQRPMPGHFKSGDSKWLPANYSHTLTNVGHNPAKFITLEFP